MLAWRRPGSRRAMRRPSDKLLTRCRSAKDFHPTEGRKLGIFDGRRSQGVVPQRQSAHPTDLTDRVFLPPPRHAHSGASLPPYNVDDVAAATSCGAAGGSNSGHELLSGPAWPKKPIFVGPPRPGINRRHSRTALLHQSINSRPAGRRNADRSYVDRALPGVVGGKPKDNGHEWSATTQAVFKVLVARAVDTRYRRDSAAYLAQNERSFFQET